MKILAIDASSKATGIAVFEEGKPIYTNLITSSSTDLIKRLSVMQDGITEILNKYPDIETVVLEEVRPDTGYNNKTYKALMYVQCIINIAVYNFNKKIKIEYLYPSSWRTKVGIKNGRGIKREELKKADIAWAKDTWGISAGDDICDALGIGTAFCKEMNKPTIEEINWE